MALRVCIICVKVQAGIDDLPLANQSASEVVGVEQEWMDSFAGLFFGVPEDQSLMPTEPKKMDLKDLALVNLIRTTLAKKLHGVRLITKDQTLAVGCFCQMWLESIYKRATSE